MGYPSRDNRDYKVFKMCVNGYKYTNLGLSKRAKLYVNREQEKIEFFAETSRGRDLNVNVSWSFDLLRERIDWKLKYLVVVLANNKFVNDDEYFKYSEIYFYKMKDFDTFLWLIENGAITITFNIDFFKSGRRMGQVYDHGTCFSISYSYINELYERITINSD